MCGILLLLVRKSMSGIIGMAYLYCGRLVWMLSCIRGESESSR